MICALECRGNSCRLIIMDWGKCSEIERRREVVSGAWVFTGTRVPVSTLFENLEDGATVDEFLEWFPGVRRKQVDEVLSFAAASLIPSVA